MWEHTDCQPQYWTAGRAVNKGTVSFSWASRSADFVFLQGVPSWYKNMINNEEKKRLLPLSAPSKIIIVLHLKTYRKYFTGFSKWFLHNLKITLSKFIHVFHTMFYFQIFQIFAESISFIRVTTYSVHNNIKKVRNSLTFLLNQNGSLIVFWQANRISS